MGKTVFERLGLVERVSNGGSEMLPPVDESLYQPDAEPLPEVSVYGDAEVSGENHKKAGDDFILSTYEKDDLMDEKRSVFKIEELRSTLPDTLPKDAQRESVKKMLNAFGLDRNEMVKNGELRIETLTSELERYMKERSDEISDMETQIDEAKILIQKLEAEIQETREVTKAIDLAVEDQVSRIEELCKFIDGPDSREEA